MPTIDVTPMTTPRIVRNDRSLFVRIVPIAIVTISASSPARMAMVAGSGRLYSRRSASIGSRLAARTAG